MPRQLKTPSEKLKTKISNLIAVDNAIKDTRGKIKVRNKILFSYDKDLISYTKNRYFPSKIDSLVEEDYEVCIPLTSENINLLAANISNPPRGAKLIIDLFRKNNKPSINRITIGSAKNFIKNNDLFVSKEFYDNITKINKEEGKDKAVRFNNRVIPFLDSSFNIKSNNQVVDRDYSLLLEEIIASGQVSQQDIIELTSKLDQGNNINVVVEKQIIKQAEWLIEKIQEILDEGKITTQKAKDLGNLHFGFPKTSITGPEHLMEKILTKYGKYTLFGVPVLLNTDKYVVNKRGISRSQFDIILVNHLADIEVVELKRSDATILDYDEGRNKFYASKDLSIAVSQAERYISAVYRENDEDYKINNQKIRDFLNKEIGGAMTVEIVRPKALIILGSYLTIAPDYSKLDSKIKRKVPNTDYNANYLQAYKELKEAYKNIHILTYSELIETARTRLLKQDD